jgi:hypothetical protein
MKRRIWLVVGVAGVLIAGTVWFAARVPFSSDILRKRLTSSLAEQLDSDVELGALTLRVLPHFQAKGEHLVVRYRGRRDVPPLFSVSTFTVDATLAGLWRRHVSRVVLEQLEIQIPPGTSGDSLQRESSGGPHLIEGRHVIVDVLEAPGSRLVVLPRRPDKRPKVWNLHELRAESVGVNTTMPYRAVLTNAVPPGFIFTEGSFGPWHIDEPGHTPLQGKFTFDAADLSVFKGIAGMLSAEGEYRGSLEHIEVNGKTDTPDFAVKISGHKVPLKAEYSAIVDATNGNTALENVRASFLDTTIVANGGVFDVEGVPGRIITLNISSEDGRLEDFMTLAVPTQSPPMTGALSLTASFELPPGDRDVVDKLRLKGRFAIEGGRFTDQDVQRRINTLSSRARGKPVQSQGVSSSFAGDFELAEGIMRLPRLTFDVPGAIVDINGRYALRSETLLFAGDLVMDAKLSQTTTGWRSFLLRAVDPLFRRNGRTVVPIRITGSRDTPSFGLDVKRALGPG